MTPEFAHRTVLAKETVALLAAAPGKVILDGTLGAGGHALALLDAGARVVGIDQDPAALSAARARLEGRDVVIAHGNFRDARAVLDSLEIAKELIRRKKFVYLCTNGILMKKKMDLFEPSPYFSWVVHLDGMRERHDEWDENALARILDSLGEERFARRIAREIHHAHSQNKLADTKQLADLVAAAIPRKAWPAKIHPATRTFQALRIAVNDELGALSEWLVQLPRIVSRGGRAAAISFHSLEDRLVKQGFAKLATGCICPPDLPVCACGRTAQWKVLTRKPVQAAPEEVAENPRARSARLRAVERLS